jgi:hypothetical protein
MGDFFINCVPFPAQEVLDVVKNHGSLNQDRRSSGRDLNLRPFEYNIGLLATQPRHSVRQGDL